MDNGETGNIGYKRRSQTKQKETQHRKLKR